MTVASVDLGTNTILLLIAEVDVKSGEIKTIANHYSIPRIGRGLKPGFPFPAENIKKMFDVLDFYSRLIQNYKCEKIIFTATNAFRIASDSKDIKEEIKERYNVELDIISGEEECKYAFLGAVSGHTNNKNYLVIDIGGGSTEIIYGAKNKILFNKSFDAGVVSGTEKYFRSDPPLPENISDFSEYIKSKLKEISSSIISFDKAIAIAGTPTTLACIKLGLNEFNEEKIEGAKIRYEEMENFVSELSNLSSKDILVKYSPVVKGREDVLLAGTITLKIIMELVKATEVEVSTRGIRYGAVVNWIKKSSS
jgi:exopolyphosphatase / guanosine-5'-triphosphate,3'-diphosphate pyrophosphatase